MTNLLMNGKLLALAGLATVCTLGLSGCGNGVEPTAAASAGSAAPASSVATPFRTPSATSAASDSATPEASEVATPAPSTSSEADAETSATQKTSRPAASTSKASSTCTVADLDVGVKTPAGAHGAGSTYVLLTFTNSSSSSCALYGYAGVSFVGEGNGTQLGAAAARVSADDPRQVILDPGATETELLKIANAGMYDAEACAPTTADGFRVYPPASKESVFVKYGTEACQRGDSAALQSSPQLQVSPVGTSN